jgi:hypothetical protein
MERRLILRGAAAGGFAGLLCAIFTRFMAEPWIQKAINFESAHDQIEDALRRSEHLAPLPPGPDIFSRGVQRNVGAPIGLIVFGMAMGAVFAVVFILLYRRYGDALGPRALALVVAGFALLGIYLIPYLKYPANPPAIGHTNTIHARGNLYLGMVATTIASLIAAYYLARVLSARWGGWNGTIVTGVLFIAWMAIVMTIFPSLGSLHQNVTLYGRQMTETPLPVYSAAHKLIYPGFPADILFKFRLYSVLNQVLLWGTTGLGFGLLAERALVPGRARAPQRRATDAAVATA